MSRWQSDQMALELQPISEMKRAELVIDLIMLINQIILLNLAIWGIEGL